MIDAKDKLIAKLQRAAERRGAHLLFLIDANDRKKHEIKKLEARLLAIYKVSDNPDAVRQIVEKSIPRAMKRWRERKQ